MLCLTKAIMLPLLLLLLGQGPEAEGGTSTAMLSILHAAVINPCTARGADFSGIHFSLCTIKILKTQLQALDSTLRAKWSFGFHSESQISNRYEAGTWQTLLKPSFDGIYATAMQSFPDKSLCLSWEGSCLYSNPFYILKYFCFSFVFTFNKTSRHSMLQKQAHRTETMPRAI